MTTFDPPPDDAQPPAPAPAEPQPAAPSGAGTLSPDGRWMWDGAQWTPAPPPPPPPYGYAPPPPGYGAPAGYPAASGYPPPGYGPPGYPTPGYPMAAVGPAPGLAYAGFWIRAGAAAIDALIFVVPVIVFITVIGVYGAQEGGNNGGVAVGVLGLVLTFVAACAYAIVLPAQGGTWGMRVLKLRVARADNGANIGYALALGRFLVYVAIGFVPFGQFLDVLWICWDDRKQALHDKALSTFVVRPLV